eukprot:m.46045 g.46045  ORF g.46045 m.46045 type:complete len:187 (-) comp17480_c0_seq2:171-731(-)
MDDDALVYLVPPETSEINHEALEQSILVSPKPKPKPIKQPAADPATTTPAPPPPFSLLTLETVQKFLSSFQSLPESKLPPATLSSTKECSQTHDPTMQEHHQSSMLHAAKEAFLHGLSPDQQKNVEILHKQGAQAVCLLMKNMQKLENQKLSWLVTNPPRERKEMPETSNLSPDQYDNLRNALAES